MFSTNGRQKTAPSKVRRIAGLSTVLAIGIGSLSLGVATSASAVEDTPWTPQSSATLFPVYENEEQCYDGGQLVLVSASLDEDEGERIGNFAINGNPLPGDAEYRVGVGEYAYTYTVTNLNSTADPQESVSLGGAFSVVACEVPEPPASPSVGQSTATGELVDGKPIATVTVPVTVPEGASGELGVWFGEEQQLSANQPVGTTGNFVFTGEVPCGTTDFAIVLDGFLVGNTSVTIDCTVPNPNPNPGDGGTGNPNPGTGNQSGNQGGTDSTVNNGSGPKTIADTTTRPGAGTGDTVEASAASASPLLSIQPGVYFAIAGIALLVVAGGVLTPAVRARANR